MVEREEIQKILAMASATGLFERFLRMITFGMEVLLQSSGYQLDFIFIYCSPSYVFLSSYRISQLC